MSTATSTAERIAEIGREIETRTSSIRGIIGQAQDLGRDLDDSERFLSQRDRDAIETLEAELVALHDEEIQQRSRDRGRALQGEIFRMAGHGGAEIPGILDVSQDHLDHVQRLIETRASGMFDPRVFYGPYGPLVETRAALTTSTYASPRAWGSNVLGTPRLLHMVARIPVQPVDAVTAANPKFTLPTAAAMVAEGIALSEYATSVGGTVQLGRYGRWTDLTAESRVGTSAEGLLSMHRLAVALDLEKIVVVEADTAAGAAVAFTADVPAAIRRALAAVRASTACGTPDAEFVLVNPADASLLQAVTPTGGESIGQQFPKFSGANVYESNAVTAGFMVVANLSAGQRFYQAQELVSNTILDVKTGIQTYASSVIAGVGSVVTGYSVKVDVVTP